MTHILKKNRTLQVLFYLAENYEKLHTVNSISAELTIPHTTIYSILQKLRENNYVRMRWQKSRTMYYTVPNTKTIQLLRRIGKLIE